MGGIAGLGCKRHPFKSQGAGWLDAPHRSRNPLLLDIRINEELAREGMAREVVPPCPGAAEKSGLEMEDRIALHFATGVSGPGQVPGSWFLYLCPETLAVEWAKCPA